MKKIQEVAVLIPGMSILAIEIVPRGWDVESTTL